MLKLSLLCNSVQVSEVIYLNPNTVGGHLFNSKKQFLAISDQKNEIVGEKIFLFLKQNPISFPNLPSYPITKDTPHQTIFGVFEGGVSLENFFLLNSCNKQKWNKNFGSFEGGYP